MLSHSELALAVARARKPCLVEKPMAMTYAQCQHVEVFDTLATDERAQRWRFDPAVSGGGLFLDMGSHWRD